MVKRCRGTHLFLLFTPWSKNWCLVFLVAAYYKNSGSARWGDLQPNCAVCTGATLGFVGKEYKGKPMSVTWYSMYVHVQVARSQNKKEHNRIYHPTFQCITCGSVCACHSAWFETVFREEKYLALWWTAPVFSFLFLLSVPEQSCHKPNKSRHDFCRKQTVKTFFFFSIHDTKGIVLQTNIDRILLVQRHGVMKRPNRRSHFPLRYMLSIDSNQRLISIFSWLQSWGICWGFQLSFGSSIFGLGGEGHPGPNIDTNASNRRFWADSYVRIVFHSFIKSLPLGSNQDTFENPIKVIKVKCVISKFCKQIISVTVQIIWYFVPSQFWFGVLVSPAAPIWTFYLHSWLRRLVWAEPVGVCLHSQSCSDSRGEMFYCFPLGNANRFLKWSVWKLT